MFAIILQKVFERTKNMYF